MATNDAHAAPTARRPRPATAARTALAINNYYYPRGGAEVAFLEQNRIFQEAGWRTVPFAMQHPDNLDTPWSRFFVDEIEYGRSYSALGSAARAVKVVYSTEARRKLGGLLDEVRPDVAHAHNIYHHLSPSILSLLKERGVPTVMTLHDLKLLCPAYRMLAPDGVCERCKGGRLFNVVRHRCLKGSLAVSGLAYVESSAHRALGSYSRHVDAFIVPSRFFLEKFVDWGFPRERLRYIPNFVDADGYQAATRAGHGFLYFGRLAPEKGIATLLAAARAAAVPVTLVGTGPEADAARQLAQQMGCDARFLGYLRGSALHEAVRNARAVVLPSEWYENAPLAVLEAYALGVPVIGAHIGGIPELIRPGETGAVVPSGDADALARTLAHFAGLPPAQVVGMGRAAREYVQRHFTPELHRSRLLALYREIGVDC